MIGIDLGSNTISFVLMDCETLERKKDIQRIVRTAEDLEKTGIISKKAVDRIIKAILEAQKDIDFSSNKIKAVATAALRLAKNRQEVLEEIKKETGVEFEIIDGFTEAKLTSIAVKERLKKLSLPYDNFANIDLGGGSTEIILQYKDEIFTKSIDVGIVTFAQKHQTLNKIKENSKKAYKEMEIFVKDIYKKYQKPSILTATAGTPTTIASFIKKMDYANYDYSKINGTPLSTKDIQEALKKLLNLDMKEREKWVGVGRGDLIIAGIYLLIALIELMEFDKIVVIDDSLKEGVAIKECKKVNLNKFG